MAKEDTALKVWFSDKARFADLFNVVLFDGMQIVKSEELTLVKGESVSVVENKNEGKDKAIQRYRDVIMRWKNACNLLILACENQGEVNFGMPVRLMTYDGLSYTEQIKEIENDICNKTGKKMDIYYSDKLKEVSLMPVITIVFYYGDKHWNGAKDLYSMFGDNVKNMGMLLEKYVSNYKVNLFEINSMTDFSRFKSDLQIVLNMLNYRKDKKGFKKYIDDNREYFSKVTKETIVVLGLLLNAKNIFNNIAKEGKEEIDMCLALEELVNDAKISGREEGREEGIRVLVETLTEMGMAKIKIKTMVVDKYSLSEDEVKKYM